jgi:hypothetical protein
MASTRLSFEGQGSLWCNTASINPGSCGSAAVTLVSVTDANAKVGDIISCSANAALTANLALGQPYCAVAGTIVIPVINPTAGSISQGAVTVSYKILRSANS